MIRRSRAIRAYVSLLGRCEGVAEREKGVGAVETLNGSVRPLSVDVEDGLTTGKQFECHGSSPPCDCSAILRCLLCALGDRRFVRLAPWRLCRLVRKRLRFIQNQPEPLARIGVRID